MCSVPCIDEGRGCYRWLDVFAREGERERGDDLTVFDNSQQPL